MPQALGDGRFVDVTDVLRVLARVEPDDHRVAALARESVGEADADRFAPPDGRHVLDPGLDVREMLHLDPDPVTGAQAGIGRERRDAPIEGQADDPRIQTPVRGGDAGGLVGRETVEERT